jgi:hypothetical protein
MHEPYIYLRTEGKHNEVYILLFECACLYIFDIFFEILYRIVIISFCQFLRTKLPSIEIHEPNILHDLRKIQKEYSVHVCIFLGNQHIFSGNLVQNVIAPKTILNILFVRSVESITVLTG